MQTNLIDQLSAIPSNQKLIDQFIQYHKENRHVFESFCDKALELINAGREHYGAKSICEVLRYETTVSGADSYKINNNYTAFYARLFEFRFPQHKGFFARRKAEADKCKL